MFGHLSSNFQRVRSWLGALLLFALAAAAVGLLFPAGALAAVSFIDSGQELGGNLESSAVVLGDLDGDGDPDAIVANYGGPSKLYINQGGDQGGTAGQRSKVWFVSRKIVITIG